MGFYEDIEKFNELYKLPINQNPTLLGIERLANFKRVLLEEVDEVDEIIKDYSKCPQNMSEEDKMRLLTKMSDWLGDMVVYIASEAIKHGINLEDVLGIIMQSNFSKLGADGNPVYDERGKVLKGPNYWAPESKIKKLLTESR